MDTIPDKDEVTSSNLVGPTTPKPHNSAAKRTNPPFGGKSRHSGKSSENTPYVGLTECGGQCGRPRLRIGTYFIQGERGGAVKIGKTTTDAEERLRNLQTANPETLILLGVVAARESEMHEKFAPYHIRGEWFACGPTLAEFIKDQFGKVVVPDQSLPWLKPKIRIRHNPIPHEQAVYLAGQRLWPYRLIEEDPDGWLIDYASPHREEGCCFPEDEDCDCDGCSIENGLSSALAAPGFIGFVHAKGDGWIKALVRFPTNKHDAISSLIQLLIAYDWMDNAGENFRASYMTDNGKFIPINLHKLWLSGIELSTEEPGDSSSPSANGRQA